MCSIYAHGYMECVGSLWRTVLEGRMQACGGAAIMDSIQQPVWAKGISPSLKGFSISGFPQQIKLNSKPCKFSYIEGSLASARQPSSASVPVLEIRGNHLSTVVCLDVFCIIAFIFVIFWLVIFDHYASAFVQFFFLLLEFWMLSSAPTCFP